MAQIKIEKVSNGYIVKFGSTEKPIEVYETFDKLEKEIRLYFQEEEKEEK